MKGGISLFDMGLSPVLCSRWAGIRGRGGVSPPRPRKDGEFACWLLPAGADRDLRDHELPNQVHDARTVLLESEVACVQQMELRIRQVSQIRVGPFGREDGVVLSPDDEGRW